MNHPLAEKIRGAIREVPNFPKPGVTFYDITTVFSNGPLLRELIDVLAARYRAIPFDHIAGIDARGFIFGAALAYALGKGFIPIRKSGKLPAAVERTSYSLEYGENVLEIHRDAVSAKDQIVVIDDLLATGGTARAACELILRLGGNVVECGFVIELATLGGRARLTPTTVASLVKYN